MSSKDKENTMNKLKQLFRKGRATGVIPEQQDFSLNEIECQIQPETPVAQRCKALREICDSVRKTPLEDTEIKKLWDLTKDLIVPNKPAEQRQTALSFYCNLIHGQYESLSIMRAHFFRVIQDHEVADDIAHRLELLKTLTDNGKNITYFEESIGEFMLRWLPAIIQAGLTEPYLEIVVNMIKFNAAHLDKIIIVGIVQHACYLSCFMDDTKTVLQCLNVLDATLCYTVFPTETLSQCIIALCRTVNIEMYCQMSWKIMKNLLGTNLGHAALLLMCNILNDSAMYSDEALLRGAVFHINMGLWGSSGVPMLRCSPSVVLQSFLHALGSKRLIVTFEVILSIQRLIKTSGKDLSEPTWDVICDILFTIAENITYYEKINSLPKDRMLQTSFHEILNIIEAYMQRNEIAANPENMYALIEIVSADRSEQSVVQLMKYLTLKISATEPNWLQALSNFVERFYKMSNVNIRMKAIQALNGIMKDNRSSYEEEILDRVVMQHFHNIHLEQDEIVQSAVAKLLLDFARHCETKRCIDLLDIIERILHRPFEMLDSNKSYWQSIVSIVDSLIEVFLVKLYRYPSTHAVKIFNMLIAYLDKFFNVQPIMLDCSTKVRLNIYNWIMAIRANSTFHIGYPDYQNNRTIRFGYYICTDQLQAIMPQQEPGIAFTFISMRKPFKKLLDCLQFEKDWIVVQLVLKELPNMLQNKAIFQGMDMDTLANNLIRTYKNRNAPELFVPVTARPSLSEFEDIILTAIAALVPYHQFLMPRTQKELIEALRSGLFSRTPRVCVYALTILLLEVPDIMLRNVPEVLLEMSKMSTTVNVAVPVLEFLSTLNRMPNSRFANFVVVQYMYVFAISLPYTNPYKYNHYTVSLAHHVIAGWFLKCRMPLRRNFVNYLIKGFETNVQMPFHETKKVDFVTINEDSTNRKRSSSLTEQGSRRQARASLPQLQTQQQQHQQQTAYQMQQNHQQFQSKPDDALKNFHMELAETGIDFLARYTFSPCSALPKRLPTSEFLLAGGQSLTWLVGHNLITITTSGCNSIPLKTGLCDRCSALCKIASPKKSETPSSVTATMPSPETMSTKTDTTSYNKRYTKASLQHSGGQDSGSSDITSSTSSSSVQTPFPSGAQPMEGRFFRQTSSDARFTSSSISLEAITRRGSNPDTPGNQVQDQATKHESISNISRPGQPTSHPTPQQIVERERSKQTCACSCVGWAEICIRRPTGNMSWIMRNQNQVSLENMANEFPLNDLVSLFVPSLGGIFGSEFMSENSLLSECSPEALLERKISASSQVSDARSQDDEDRHREVEEFNIIGIKQNLVSSGPIAIPKPTQPMKESAGSFSDVEPEMDEDNPDIEYEDDESRSRNPVRRVNSSPEMSSNWRNPLLNQKIGLNPVGPSNVGGLTTTMQSSDDEKPLTPEIEQQQKKKGFGKDMRVSCEAIPEEIPGSTPPSNPNSIKDEGLDSNMSKSILAAKQMEASSKPATLVPSASFPIETKSDTSNLSPQNQLLPKKQLSADDAIAAKASPEQQQQQQQQQQQPTPPPLQLQLQSTVPSAKLKIPMDMPKVTTKPPQSPAPLSPRLLVKNDSNKVSSFAPSVTGGNPSNSNGSGNNGNGNNDLIRGRSKTISVVREHESRDNLKWTSFKGTRSGLSPSSIFLQLYNAGANKSFEQPIQIGPTNAKAITLLDLIPPYETHKIGVLYVSPGQASNEAEILKNRHGSMRYALFLRKLGTLVALKDAKENNLFVNMETNGRDGNYTYIWQDEIIQVTFHVATMMPNKEQDPYCHEKKKHIGNDYVSIVYNESGEEYNLNTIKGQFNYACVIVEPMELNSNRIYVRAKDEVVAQYVGHSEPEIVSDSSAPLFARQLALHANLASLVAQSLRTKNQSPYASNWLERLRKIKHLRAKILKEHAPTTSADLSNANNNPNNASSLLKMDFTTYTQ